MINHRYRLRRICDAHKRSPFPTTIQTVGEGFVIPRRRGDFGLAGALSRIFHIFLVFVLAVCSRYQRARAALVKAHSKLVAVADQMAEQRLLVWPEKKEPPDA